MLIETDELILGYSGKAVVGPVSLKVPKGEFISIIGPNGSGKSTLLKSVCGNLKPMKGGVKISGQNIEDFSPPELASKVAYLPQNPVIPEGITVDEFVSYGRFPHRTWRGMSSVKDRKIVERALKSTGLLNFRHRYLTQLSGGELQRSRIAMVMAQKAEIVVFDEPTTFLDISHQYEILNQISSMNREIGITVIMVVHDLNQGASFSNRVLVLNEGAIYKDGPPSEVISVETLKDVFGVKATIIESPFHIIIEGV